MFGASFSLNITRFFLIDLSVYAGYGMANGSQQVYAKSSSGFQSYELTFSGGGFVIEVPLGIVFKIGRIISLGINLGYRYANIPELKFTKDVVEVNARNGEIVKDLDGNNLSLDFSGFNINFNIGFLF